MPTLQATGITIKSPREMDRMRRAGKVVADAKAVVSRAVRPGITTKELDQIAEEEILKQGAIPAFKGLYGFPATVCTSINEEIVHGIPSERTVLDGDILSVDFGAIVGGFYADSAFTMGVGTITSDAQDLIDATKEALNRGIEQVKEGARIGDISAAIQTYSEGKGYGVVRQYVGHGIGRALHEDPQVPNYGVSGRGPLLKVGMAIAIEPMLNVGTWETRQLDDGWTIVTNDGALSAHFEDTVAITEKGAEVFTGDNYV